MLATAFDTDSVSVRSCKSRGVFPTYHQSMYNFGGNPDRKPTYINELDLFKLAAINMPRHSLLHAMPVNLQVDSTEVNRLRSHYIKMIVAVWRVY